MEVRLEKLTLENSLEILAFETENRPYFETCLMPREDSYYTVEGFKQLTAKLLKEQENGKCYMYLIKNNEGNLTGRINLFLLDDTSEQIAELGYRIGSNYTGMGIATEAVKLLLKESINVKRIIAGTDENNIASQKVLEKNGFICESRTGCYAVINYKAICSLNFVKSIDETSKQKTSHKA
ncbi:GNAT family N-acetyltransferase [Mollicutes bacterium LVI A0039]|nr:GNAT family N-acetyltransferase [Mollicutes bacterium LVI A0039]